VKPLTSDKLANDYQNFSQNIEFLSQQAMQDVREKIEKIKKAALVLGENIEG
jgi:hypothetical protein